MRMKRPSQRQQNKAILASREQRQRASISQAQNYWLHCKAVREALPEGERRGNGDQVAGVSPLAIRRGFQGPRPKRCQWIEGAPRGDDSCKCGAAVAPGKPYCDAHWSRAWRPAGKVEL